MPRSTGKAVFQLFQYVNVALLELSDGCIQRALDRFINLDQRRVLQGLVMDERIYVLTSDGRKGGLPSLVLLVKT
ncbi:hypothetical protein B9L19_01530 [Geobacillus thermocatenulatus]|uniref:Uncharacterized protein n=1 Tax=Geobacillus thermocatenulatus TaxID=33938 RepID=A0A226QBK0_9BACL|nr:MULTISPECIES: hypothetical protein [Geobacillus]KPC97183.1 hypothetical protein LR69_04610 [Geobacillus sp. BCO2]RAN22259.1 hypothetical protein VC88_12280 [Geobacillus sp. A8]ASS98078.1 hypothetical protein GT3921_02815 [Geobacillus thermocatenulatus]KLR74524.1 hypothetical protein ABH20_05285 [Geobacillus sp. T6]OXB88822.1 hypothetical protein B9L19_01530 [Geobacillus thermocatenulatus]